MGLRYIVRCGSLALVVGIAACARGSATPVTPALPIFVFETNELWLNLHHFLYVLGRAEANRPDARREAVLRAPADQQRGLATMTADEQRRWREAVRFYRDGPSTKDAVFDQGLAGTTLRLSEANDAVTLGGGAIDTALTRVLEGVAPLYRRVWWPEHQAANEAWVAQARQMLDKYGRQTLAFITNAYGQQWQAGGYPVHVSGYANWAGAYSTDGLLVLSSLAPDVRGPYGLEILFHEAMHLWDSQVSDRLQEHARANGVLVPEALTHVMIFWTAGEAVKRQIPNHVPFAIRYGVYDRGWRALRDAVAEVWQPYLEGRVTRDDALAALVKRTGIERRPASSLARVLMSRTRILSAAALAVVAFASLTAMRRAAQEPLSTVALMFTTGPGWDTTKSPRNQAHFATHSANLQRLRQAGVIVAGGRFGQYGLILVRAPNVDSARAMLRPDSSIAVGTFVVQVERWATIYEGSVTR